MDETIAALVVIEAREGELERELGAARDWHAKLEAAIAGLCPLTQCAANFAESAAEKHEAARQHGKAERLRESRRDERRRARDGFAQAAKGLADLQHGIDELHRRAGAFRLTIRRLRGAEAHLQSTALPPSQFASQLALAHGELEEVDRQRRGLRTRLADADEHRERRAKLIASLLRLTEQDIEANAAHEAATAALRRFRQQCLLAEQLSDRERELAEAARLHAQQARVRGQALVPTWRAPVTC